jgi:hypothetical protein
MTTAKPPEDPLAGVLRELSRLAAEEASHHAQGHLLRSAGSRLELQLALPLTPADDFAAAAARLREELRVEIAAQVSHRAAFRPGHVLDLRHPQKLGPETQPADARKVFVGFSATGAPLFLDFAQWLLQSKHPRLDLLYAKPPGLVIVQSSAEELYVEVLPPFRQPDGIDWRLHGQVAGGFFEVPRADGTPGQLALTFQVQSSAAKKGGRRRFGLNLLGVGPGGEKLEHLMERLAKKTVEPAPWQNAAAWAQTALDTIEQGQGRGGGDPAELDRRIEGILGGFVRRLEQDRRARGRRTGHAEERHQQGDRPTRHALQDLSRAKIEDILVDARSGTFVVLGDRGRAHVWSGQGKLVTSLRTTPESIERKKKRDLWRAASPAEGAELRRVAGA